MTPIDALTRLEQAEKELHAAFRELSAFTRATLTGAAARAEDDDDWTRMPARPARCPVSNWSRSTLENKSRAGVIRTKRIGGMRYYALKDVRTYLATGKPPSRSSAS